MTPGTDSTDVPDGTSIILANILEQLSHIADALVQSNMIALSARPDSKAPNLRRPLSHYANFDPATIGAVGAWRDDFGWTEMEWNGRIFKRYASRDDDEKGTDVRFRRVVSGTVAEKNMVWETLIKFGDWKPAKKLRGDLAELVKSQQVESVANGHTPAPAPIQAPASSNGQHLGYNSANTTVIGNCLKGLAVPSEAMALIGPGNGATVYWTAVEHWKIDKTIAKEIAAEARRSGDWLAAVQGLDAHTL